MSVAEMKLEAINKITGMQDEAILKEVLSYLEEKYNNKGEYNLSRHYDAIKEQYGDVLEKLAQ